jgi:hypothetical protein
VLNKESTSFDLMIASDRYHAYGQPYGIDVLLDGNWYIVPFVPKIWPMPVYTLDPDSGDTVQTHEINPLIDVGVLPEGQYRLTKEFDPHDNKTPTTNQIKEFAVVEFTVTEDLVWHGESFKQNNIPDQSVQ